MSEETLMTAAHRLSRFFRVDMESGGLVVDETLQAGRTLEREIKLAELGKEHDAELLVASRAAVRDFNLDMTKHGGMVAVSTEIAFNELDKAIRNAGGRQ